MVNPAFWRGKRVFLTGHTGFKGGWLGLWLHELGAQVTGYALPAPTTPSFFSVAHIENLVESRIGDIREKDALTQAMQAAEPEIVFHLAAQSLVSEGYRDPVGTYATNVTGTLNLLEAARPLNTVRAIVIVTTDKCYENSGSTTPYCENSPLGGHDPYSSSKACTEILTHAWRRSFFTEANAAHIATARAGNVIGGGDWAENRLVPDILRAFSLGQTAVLRQPESVRPWQHVLEPLAGYLGLAQHLWNGNETEYAWNFGPTISDCVSARSVADQLTGYWQRGANWSAAECDFPHEAKILMLDASLAQKKLQWAPRWPLTEALHRTVDWHLAWLEKENMQEFSKKQLTDYAFTANTEQ